MTEGYIQYRDTPRADPPSRDLSIMPDSIAPAPARARAEIVPETGRNPWNRGSRTPEAQSYDAYHTLSAFWVISRSIRPPGASRRRCLMSLDLLASPIYISAKCNGPSRRIPLVHTCTILQA